MTNISLVKGDNRKTNIENAIRLINKDIDQAIRRKKSDLLFIKINAIDPNYPHACTHINALETTLKVFYPRFKKTIVGDNSFAFTRDNGGYYRQLLKKFPNVEFSDLTEFKTEKIGFKKLDGTISYGEISTLPQKAFTISLALPKTHDTFVYTGCLKNMFGCVIKNRAYLHVVKFYERLNLNHYVKSNQIRLDNLIQVIKRAKADLYLLDAYEGMENEGPLHGTMIKLGLAIGSTSGVAIDTLAAEICGLAPVPYLSILSRGQPSPLVIKKGFKETSEISKKLKPHYGTEFQTTSLVNSKIPIIDYKFALSVIKRSYRIKDKLLEKIADRFYSH